MSRLLGPLRALVWALALLGVLVGAVGCGLTADGEPQAIDAEDLPPDLLDPNPPTSTTLDDTATTSVTVYLLVRAGTTTRLSPTQRDVADPTSLGERVRALLAATSAREQDEGLISSIPSDTVLLDADLNEADEELVIDLSGAFFDVQGQELANAFAQLVYTVTEISGVRRVRFKVDGEPQRAPNAEGIEQDGAVTRADYAALAPR